MSVLFGMFVFCFLLIIVACSCDVVLCVVGVDLTRGWCSWLFSWLFYLGLLCMFGYHIVVFMYLGC